MGLLAVCVLRAFASRRRQGARAYQVTPAGFDYTRELTSSRPGAGDGHPVGHGLSQSRPYLLPPAVTDP
jgi:hypothetical protein